MLYYKATTILISLFLLTAQPSASKLELIIDPSEVAAILPESKPEAEQQQQQQQPRPRPSKLLSTRSVTLSAARRDRVLARGGNVNC